VEQRRSERGLDKTVPKRHASVENYLETFYLSVSLAVSDNITIRGAMFSISFYLFRFRFRFVSSRVVSVCRLQAVLLVAYIVQ
jgi:hypothetical protein